MPEYVRTLRAPPEYSGLSTADKPTSNVTGGSRFREIDTGDEYIFDHNEEWCLLARPGTVTDGDESRQLVQDSDGRQLLQEILGAQNRTNEFLEIIAQAHMPQRY